MEASQNVTAAPRHAGRTPLDVMLVNALDSYKSEAVATSISNEDVNFINPLLFVPFIAGEILPVSRDLLSRPFYLTFALPCRCAQVLNPFLCTDRTSFLIQKARHQHARGYLRKLGLDLVVPSTWSAELERTLPSTPVSHRWFVLQQSIDACNPGSNNSSEFCRIEKQRTEGVLREYYSHRLNLCQPLFNQGRPWYVDAPFPLEFTDLDLRVLRDELAKRGMNGFVLPGNKRLRGVNAAVPSSDPSPSTVQEAVAPPSLDDLKDLKFPSTADQDYLELPAVSPSIGASTVRSDDETPAQSCASHPPFTFEIPVRSALPSYADSIAPLAGNSHNPYMPTFPSASIPSPSYHPPTVIMSEVSPLSDPSTVMQAPSPPADRKRRRSCEAPTCRKSLPVSEVPVPYKPDEDVLRSFPLSRGCQLVLTATATTEAMALTALPVWQRRTFVVADSCHEIVSKFKGVLAFKPWLAPTIGTPMISCAPVACQVDKAYGYSFGHENLSLDELQVLREGLFASTVEQRRYVAVSRHSESSAEMLSRIQNRSEKGTPTIMSQTTVNAALCCPAGWSLRFEPSLACYVLLDHVGHRGFIDASFLSEQHLVVDNTFAPAKERDDTASKDGPPFSQYASCHRKYFEKFMTTAELKEIRGISDVAPPRSSHVEAVAPKDLYAMVHRAVERCTAVDGQQLPPGVDCSSEGRCFDHILREAHDCRIPLPVSSYCSFTLSRTRHAVVRAKHVAKWKVTIDCLLERFQRFSGRGDDDEPLVSALKVENLQEIVSRYDSSSGEYRRSLLFETWHDSWVTSATIGRLDRMYKTPLWIGAFFEPMFPLSLGNVCGHSSLSPSPLEASCPLFYSKWRHLNHRLLRFSVTGLYGDSNQLCLVIDSMKIAVATNDECGYSFDGVQSELPPQPWFPVAVHGSVSSLSVLFEPEYVELGHRLADWASSLNDDSSDRVTSWNNEVNSFAAATFRGTFGAAFIPLTTDEPLWFEGVIDLR